MEQQHAVDDAEPMGGVEVLNAAPEIISTPVTEIRRGEVYLYQVTAADADEDSLTWSLDAAPAGMQFDPRSGTLAAADLPAGRHPVKISVTDGNGGSSEQAYTLTVDDGPVIFSRPAEYTFAGTPYRYLLQAGDPDGLELSYFLAAGPSGMTVDPETGVLEWTAGSAGVFTIEARVANALGKSATQSFLLTVLSLESATIVSTPPIEGFVSQPYEYRLSVISAGETGIYYSLNEGPPGMTVDAAGLIRWTPSAAGAFPVVISAVNAHGFVDTQEFTIRVRSLEAMDSMFNEMIDGLFRSLGDGDFTEAGRYLTRDALARLAPQLTDLAPYMDEVSGNYTGAVRVSLNTDTAEYLVRRTGGTGAKVFMVTFLRDFNGDWKVNDL